MLMADLSYQSNPTQWRQYNTAYFQVRKKFKNQIKPQTDVFFEINDGDEEQSGVDGLNGATAARAAENRRIRLEP